MDFPIYANSGIFLVNIQWLHSLLKRNDNDSVDSDCQKNVKYVRFKFDVCNPLGEKKNEKTASKESRGNIMIWIV